MTDTIRVNELEDESLRNQFNDLMEAMEDITTFDPNREEGAYEALNQRIYQAVTEQPILARIVNENDQSLLSFACSCLNLDTSHNVIKCLILSYPSALLGHDDSIDRHIPIYMVAHHPEHCVLLPWIVTNYTWALDHDRYHQVVFGLIGMYANRSRTSCTATTLKQFFEAYPQAFTQQQPDDSNILLNLLKNTNECEADLFKWIAERCQSSTLSETDSNGNALLHLACRLLVIHKGRNSSEICKYLIQKRPGSAQMTNRFYNLPIHYLQDSCEYRLVREVLVCLLREYPEAYDVPVTPYDRRLPSSIPFIQSIKPYLDEEKELKETVKSLTGSISSLTEAVFCTNDELMTSGFAVFDSWATSFINTTDDKLQLISTKLQDLCNEGR